MDDGTRLNTTNRMASVENVEKAISLLKLRVQKTEIRKRKSQLEIRETLTNGQCLFNFTSFHKKPTAILAFTQNHAVVEMRNALIHEDWATMQKTFPILLKGLHSQNIVWRHAFLLYLLCPYSDLTSFQEFVRMTVGTRFINNELYLKKLMTLRAPIQNNNS